jgi:hypothetical protein
MPLYFMHLRDGTEETPDDEGREFTDMDSIRKTALAEARELMSGDLKTEGVIDLRFRIDAEAEDGTLIYSLPFSDAVRIIAPE